ncbi:unnamed protein product [Adineta ricciae]|uniref:DDE-1 domain-containing protein n=1 Tax=Adineta ricciae TaxID=249248 RepID=A0A815U5V4_ADIRI|nr:unnamed protein product [Adineta ricciae]
MGAFLPRDICNFDESPISLFGDQTSRTLNYVNVDNEVENPICSKRFATVILTIFPKGNDRVGPTLLFRGKGRISSQETNQYSKNVKVFFTQKAAMNTETMHKFVDYWYGQINDGNPKLMITDSYGCHLNSQVTQSLRRKSVVVAVVPKGCTQYLQLLDTLVFSTFKSNYFNATEEFLEKNGNRTALKLTASQSRVLCTRLTWEAWKRTLKSIDLKKGFLEIGYTWCNNSIVTPRTLPGYKYDPSCVPEIQLDDDENDNDTTTRIEEDATADRCEASTI